MTSTLDQASTRPDPESASIVTDPPVGSPARTRVRTTLAVLFVIYLALLIWIVLWKLDVVWVGGTQRSIKLVPFVPSGGAGASNPIEVVTNLVLFVPFGVYLGLLAPTWRWWKHMGVIAGASLGLETTQYVLAVGSADITDLVVNTAGGVAGIGLLALAHRVLHARTTIVMTLACVVGTVLALLACAAFIASPLRFGGPPPGHDHGPRLERSETRQTPEGSG